MTTMIAVLGEALMDCVAQPGGDLRPLIGGSPFNMARAAARRGAPVCYLNPISVDLFGDQIRAQLQHDGVQVLAEPSRLPTSLAVVQVDKGQPSYGFYREGIADRDYGVDQILAMLARQRPGVLHTGSLLLVPPEDHKVLAIVHGAKALGWTISLDVNLRPRLAPDLSRYVAAVQQIAALADWIKASDDDLSVLGFADATRAHAVEIAAKFKTHGARRVALTFGAQGAWLDVDGVVAHAAGRAVDVVDTVGAGDTFWGNCVADWVLSPGGAAQRVQATLDYAATAAAINCTRAGCQPPGHDEVLQVLARP
jgi:fructokinase